MISPERRNRFFPLLILLLLTGLTCYLAAPGFGQNSEQGEELDIDRAVGLVLKSHRLLSLARVQVEKAQLEWQEAQRQADLIPEEAVESYELAVLKYLYPLQAESQYRLARRRLSGMEENLEMAARLSYLGVLLAREMEKVAEEGLALAQEKVQLTKSALEAGMVTPGEVLAAEARELGASATLAQVRSGRESAELGLRRLLGWDSKRPLIMVQGDLEFVPAGTWDLDKKSALAQGNRFEMVRASEMVRLAEKQLELALEFPSGGFVGFPDVPGDIDLPFPWPPSWGEGADWERSERYTIPKAQMEYREATLGWHLQREEVIHQVKDLHLRLREAEWAVVAKDKAVEAARESVRVAILKHQSGMLTGAELAGVQLALASARGDYLQAVFNHHRARLQQEHSWSRGFADNGGETSWGRQ